MNRKATFITVLFISIFTLSSAQEAWTLEKCINYAIDNNIQIKRQKLGVELSDNDLLNSKAQVLPNLNVGVNYSKNSGRSLSTATYEYVDESFSNTSFGLSSGINLFQGLQNYNNIVKSRIDLDASLADLEDLKFNVSLNVATAFMQILYDKELLSISEEQVKLAELDVEKTKALVEGGTKAQGDLLEMQAQLSRYESEKVQSENNVSESILKLKQTLNLQESGDFTVLGPEIKIEENTENLDDPDQIYQKSIANIPSIKAAEYRIKSSEKNLAIAKGSLSPTLSMGYSIGTWYNGTTPHPRAYFDSSFTNIDYLFGDQFNDHFGRQINFSFNIPIFNRLNSKTRIDNAKLYLLDSKLQLEQEKLNLYNNIQQAHNDANSAKKQYTASSAALSAGKESFRYMKEKYNAGLISATDYKTAFQEYITIKAELSQAKYNYVFKKAILDFYSTQDFSLAK